MLAATRLPANTLQGMMQLCCEQLLDDGNTFYSQRVFDLFPQMATANSGWNTHAADASSVFGQTTATDSTNDSDYIEWTVYLPAGSYKFSGIIKKFSAYGKADLAIDGGSVVSTFDWYGGSAAYNQPILSAAFTVTEGLHTIRLTKNGKNASSSNYTVNLQHAQLIKQDATSALSSVANVPHIIDVPIVFADSHTNWNSLYMTTADMFGTELGSTGAINATITFSFWAPKGAATLALLHVAANNRGIYSVSVDGSSWGTVDGYASSIPGIPNSLSTALSGTLATTGIHTITLTMATKHASSVSYYGSIQHIQIRMTSITEPLSADLAPEVALFWPVFNEATTGFGVAISSLQAYYNYFQSTGSQNDEITLSANTVLRPGTYSFAVLTPTGPAGGIYGLLLDGASVGTADIYTAGTVYNVVKTITGVVLGGLTPHSVKLKMATKNASSSAYYGQITLVRAIRTGA